MPSLNIVVCAKQFLLMHEDLKLLVAKRIIIIVIIISVELLSFC